MAQTPRNSIKAIVTEMTEADVSFISLVNRGANRIPFRVKKSDQESPAMINISSLAGLARILKGEAPAPAPQGPEILAVVTPALDEDHLAEVRKSLEEQGFKVDASTINDDGSVVFSQIEGEVPAEGVELVRLSENMVLVTKGYAPYTDDVLTDFNASVKTSGFYSGINAASNALADAISAILREASSPADAGSAIDGVLSDFSTFVSGLVKGLPSKAFKAEHAVSEIVRKANPNGYNQYSKGKGNGKPSGAKDQEREGDDDYATGNAGKAQTTISGSLSKLTGGSQLSVHQKEKDGSHTVSGGIEGVDSKKVHSAIEKDLKNNGFKKTDKGWESSTHTAHVTVEDDDYAEVKFTKKAKKADEEGAEVETTEVETTEVESPETPEVPAEPESPAEPEVPAEPEAPATEPVQKSEPEADPILAALAALATQVGELSVVVKAVSEKQESFEQNIDQVARKADDASKAVKGAVIASSPNTETPANGAVGQAKKADDDPRTGCFDTAFLPKR